MRRLASRNGRRAGDVTQRPEWTKTENNFRTARRCRLLLQRFLRWWTGDGGTEKLFGEKDVNRMRDKVCE